MPVKKESRAVRVVNYNDIVRIIEGVSLSMCEYLKGRTASTFVMWTKNLFHSDLSGRGKRCGPGESLNDNYLYYMTVEDMQAIEARDNNPFPDAKQSNIGFPIEFYNDCNIPLPRTCAGKHYTISDVHDVYLVNETLKYFNFNYTNLVLTRLNKKWKYASAQNYTLDEGSFTKIKLTEAVHGIGTSADELFTKIRMSMFHGDTIYILVEKGIPNNKIFILLEKNPRFFTITGLANESWIRYLQHKASKLRNSLDVNEELPEQEEKTRALQSQWKDKLAKEMMTYTSHEGEVICPFTRITAKFDDLSMLFIASHIKAYADCSAAEAFDINNGLLLCANADALFDKHMITVDANGNLVFSYLIHDEILKENLRLSNKQVLSMVLNEERMKYLEEHRRVFEEKERKRKFGVIEEDGYAAVSENYPSIRVEERTLMRAATSSSQKIHVVS